MQLLICNFVNPKKKILDEILNGLILTMKKYFTVAASFILMLCLGGVYAWSIIASELIEKYHFSSTQTQVIFGTLIAVFPITMIFVGKIASRLSVRFLGYLSGFLFLGGYLLAGLSGGDFYLILLGVGILSGVATGFGYWVSISVPVQWFPERKGLVTGIAAAGFGLGALLLSQASEVILLSGKNVSQLLNIIAISYGLIIIIVSNLIRQKKHDGKVNRIKLSDFLFSKACNKLFFGIFLGTFAGLLVIGSLKLIGEQYQITNHSLLVGVSLFAVANFLGRLFWGWLSDYLNPRFTIFFALLLQSIGIFLLDLVRLSDFLFIMLSFFIGLGFGSNFVLFAKETAQRFGLMNLGKIYPYIFLGYALAGIAGPLIGGILFDRTGTYTSSVIIAGFVSLSGGFVYLVNPVKKRKI
jgi:OFA family oxalate/formate antiporter-like MFS transporter